MSPSCKRLFSSTARPHQWALNTYVGCKNSRELLSGSIKSFLNYRWLVTQFLWIQGGASAHTPLRVLILLFWNKSFTKCSYIGSFLHPRGWRPLWDILDPPLYKRRFTDVVHVFLTIIATVYLYSIPLPITPRFACELVILFNTPSVPETISPIACWFFM